MFEAKNVDDFKYLGMLLFLFSFLVCLFLWGFASVYIFVIYKNYLTPKLRNQTEAKINPFQSLENVKFCRGYVDLAYYLVLRTMIYVSTKVTVKTLKKPNMPTVVLPKVLYTLNTYTALQFWEIKKSIVSYTAAIDIFVLAATGWRFTSRIWTQWV